MRANKLQLNNEKTELLVLNSRYRPPPQLSSIYAGSELIVAADSAKSIGLWFDNTLSMNKHVNFLCKTAFYHQGNLATIRRFPSHKHCEILIHAFVTHRIDHCNSLSFGLLQHLSQKAPICSKCCGPSPYLFKEIWPHFPNFERTTLVGRQVKDRAQDFNFDF